MRNLSRIVSAILIVCMLGGCIYISDSSVEPAYATNAETTVDYINDVECKGNIASDPEKVDLEYSWTIAEGIEIDGYDVSLYEDENLISKVDDSEKNIEGTKTSVKYKGLEKGKLYYAVIKPFKNEEGTPVYGETEKCAGIYLAKPQIESAVADNSKITVKFTSVEDANSYIVNYVVDGHEKEITTAETSVDIYDLKGSATYTVQVCAAYTAGDAVCRSDWSDPATVTTQDIILDIPKMAMEPYNLGAILTWDAVANATAYEVWRYNDGAWRLITTVDGLTYTDKSLKKNKGYYFKVRAVRDAYGQVIEGEFCERQAITAKVYLTGDIRRGYDTGKLKRSSKIFVGGDPTKLASKSKLKRNTKINIIGTKKVKGKNMAHIKANGKYYWIKRANIKYNAPYTTKDYTTQAKERFVNKQGYSSKTKYLLFISHYTQKVYLFTGSKGEWELNATYKCATGKATRRSPQGVFAVTKKGKRTAAGSKYVTYFYKTNAFHARPAGSKTIGKPASNGCIRMYEKSAIYFYKNMPKGTTVVSY